MPVAYLSIGSNLSRERNIRLAVRRLRERYGHLELSSVYESDPVGFEGESFFNLAAGFESQDPPAELLAAFRSIEKESGRTRKSPKYGPRTVDLDLLMYGNLVCEQNGLELPREEITRYAFVLRPLAEIAGELRHPVVGKTIAKIWTEFDDSGQPTRRIRFDFEALQQTDVRRYPTDKAESAREIDLK